MDARTFVDRKPNMNRVVICARGFPPDVAGGGELSTALIARGLADLGVDVQVLTFTDGQRRIEHLDRLTVHRLPCPNVYWSMTADQQPGWKKAQWHLAQAFRPAPPAEVRKAVEDLRPRILHTSTLEDFGAGIWRWGRSRGLATVHTLRSYNLLHRGATLYDADQDREIGPDALAKPKRAYARSLDGVIGISRHILDKHHQHGFFPDAKTAIIGNPIDEPIDTSPRQSRGADAMIHVGILGRLSPEKGIEPFLDCLRDVVGEPQWRLSVAGKGRPEYEDHLRSIAGDLPVDWVGWKPSRDFLQTLDLLVVPSRWHEPFGRIVVEAYAVGVPVLCLRRGAMPELVQHERTGWILDDWTPAAIAHAIAAARSMDRDAIIAVATQYQVETIARKHIEFYDSLVGSA